MQSFDETLQLLSDLQRSTTLEEVCERLRGVTSLYGLDRVLITTIPESGLSPEEQLRHIIVHNWPAAWLERYTQNNYREHDPVISISLQSPAPFFWRDAKARAQNLSTSLDIFEEARAFELNDGVALPIITVEGSLVLISLGGLAADIDPQEVAILQLATNHAATRAIQLADIAKSSPAKPALTARERECIRWAAQGKSEWEISQILGISEHTSEKHLLSAKSKLGAVNRVQAVAEAIRLGYIS